MHVSNQKFNSHRSFLANETPTVATPLQNSLVTSPVIPLATPKTTTSEKLPTHAIIYSAASIALLTGAFLVGKGKAKALAKEIEVLTKEKNGLAEKLENKGIISDAKLETPEFIEKIQEKFTESKKSVVNFIEGINAKPEQIKDFLFGITADEKASQKFIKEVIENPREHQKTTAILLNKIGGEKNLLEWMFAPKGYQQAYESYIKNAVETAKSPDELIKISPNWDYNLLKNKFSEYSLGALPEGFKNADNFRDIVSKLHKGEQLPDGAKLCKEVGFSASGKGHAVVEVNDKKYLIKFRQDYSQYDPTLAKRMDEWKDLAERTNELTALKSDSTFINAQIDYYLNVNQCENAVGMHYYDSKSQASIYEYLDDFAEYKSADLLEANAALADFRSLGMTYNDLNEGNLVKVGDKIKILDSGESQFADVLRPGCPAYNYILPNLCGSSLQDSAAAIVLSKI